MEYFIVLLIVWNLISFLLMGIDKRKAKHGARRTPEWVLLTVAFLCGAAGATLGMYLFWHKVRKPRFAIGLPVMLGLQIVLASHLTNIGIFDKIYPNL